MDNANVDFYGENLKRIGLKYLELSKNSYDLVLTSSDGYRFHCHKLVLSACSPVFQNAVNYLNLQQNQYFTSYIGISYNQMEIQAVLDFIYNGTLSGLDQSNYSRYLQIARENQVYGMEQMIVERSKSLASIIEIRDLEKRLIETGAGAANNVNPMNYNAMNHPAAQKLKSSKNFGKWKRNFENSASFLFERILFSTFNDVFDNEFNCTKDGLYCITIEQEPFYGSSFQKTKQYILKEMFQWEPPMTKADLIEKEVLKMFFSIMKNDENNSKSYKVIAGIVHEFMGTLKVISIGTGSKFLHNDLSNFDGNSLIDAHAEIVARRGFIRYLYGELEKCITNTNSSVFQKANNDNPKFFQLRPGNTFHLYVSTAPCGDGRVYSHTDVDYASPANIPEGTLRTKGEEALTVLSDTRRNSSNPSMSCSAKLLKWNVLGIQGALLAKYITPIYLSSIVIGDYTFKQKHLERALYDRMGTELKGLPTNYSLNTPLLQQMTQTKAKMRDHDVLHSHNWFLTPAKTEVEVVDARSGKVMFIDKPHSQISKRAFWNKFLQIQANLGDNKDETDYVTAKTTSKTYNQAKKSFNRALNFSNIGKWVNKQVSNPWIVNDATN